MKLNDLPSSVNARWMAIAQSTARLMWLKQAKIGMEQQYSAVWNLRPETAVALSPFATEKVRRSLEQLDRA